MPGAGSIVAANYLYGIAKPDGLTIGMFQTHLYLEQMVGRPEVKFDVRKFNWLGSQEKGQMMLYIRADSPYKSIDDIIKAKEPPKCGGSGTCRSDRAIDATAGRNRRRQIHPRARLQGRQRSGSGDGARRSDLPRDSDHGSFQPRAVSVLGEKGLRPSFRASRQEARCAVAGRADDLRAHG